MAYSDIEAHGLIGNLRTAALVSSDGTIDFFCYPRFDSPTVFAALLDDANGGEFSIKPTPDGVRTRQMYRKRCSAATYLRGGSGMMFGA